MDEFIMIRNMSCYCQGCNNNLSDRACNGWSKCRNSKQSTELETNKNRRDTHAEIENQGNTRFSQTDGQTEGRTDKVIPIYPPELRSWGV
jgi:hypothetical protein